MTRYIRLIVHAVIIERRLVAVLIGLGFVVIIAATMAASITEGLKA